jgi:23S rRNA (uracil1939-C5)-methyltransferase
MKFDRTAVHQAQVTKYSHDGRGIALLNGKTTFIRGALAGEIVEFQYSKKHRRFDEGQATNIIQSASDRVTPKCQHTGICGGCQLQHMDSVSQIKLKQAVLTEQFEHFGHIEAQKWLPPMTGSLWGYRQKARLSVKHVKKKNKVLVGFREIDGRFVADIKQWCYEE